MSRSVLDPPAALLPLMSMFLVFRSGGSTFYEAVTCSMKPSPEKLNAIVDEFIKQSAVDYIGLWELAKVAREEMGAETQKEVRETALTIAVALYRNGLRAGDYDYGTRMKFWPDEGCQAMLDRIEREWIKLNENPTHTNPICSFLRPPS
jgi:hypothetical protein